MAAISRRGLLMSGGFVLGAAAVGSPIAFAAARSTPAAAPVLSAPRSPIPAAPQVPSGPYHPSYKTVPLAGAGEPVPVLSFAALPNAALMQDVVLAGGAFFATQGVRAPSGRYETTIVNRVDPTGRVLDSMTLIDGGHGYGFEVESDAGGFAVWMTWMGASVDSAGRENDFVRFRYAPGVWSRAAANQQLGLQLVPFQNSTPEAVYHFDVAKDWAVERHFNWEAAPSGSSETFTRRRISDLRAGVATAYGSITVPATPPTGQGFATVNDTLFRWLGGRVSNDTINPADAVRLEQYDWNTGGLVAVRDFPAVAQDSPGRWRGGVFEPEGMSTIREPDGTASLLVGACTGVSGDRRYHVAKFAGIGAA